MDDEISQEPKRDFRLPPGGRRWLTIAGVAGLVAAVAVFGPFRFGGRPSGGAAPAPTPTASQGVTATPGAQGGILSITGPPPVGTNFLGAPPTPGSSAVVFQQGANGTVVLSCGSTLPAELSQGWQRSSLHVGPLWFAFSDNLGYVRKGLPPRAPPAAPVHAETSMIAEMFVEVARNSSVTLKPAAGTASYFHFLAGSSDGAVNSLPPGATGLTLTSCPAGSPGSNGSMTGFLLGFSTQSGRMAPVQVWTSKSARPVWLTFTAPAALSVGASVSAGVSVQATASLSG